MTEELESEVQRMCNLSTAIANGAARDSGFVNIDYLSVPYAPDTIVEEAENAALWGKREDESRPLVLQWDGICGYIDEC